MTDHALTVEWLNEVTKLLANIPESEHRHLEQSLRATRELNRRQRQSKGVQGWCTCVFCFHWSIGDDVSLDELAALGDPRLFGDD